MEISCEIIQDLLPLYLDKKCSTASKFEIEDHVRRCDECKAVVRTLGGDPEDMNNPLTAEMLIQALRSSHKEKRERRKNFAWFMLLYVCICTVCMIAIKSCYAGKDDSDFLARLAVDRLGYDGFRIEELQQSETCLVALGVDNNDQWHICTYESFLDLEYNMWKPDDEHFSIVPGKISILSPADKSVLIICGTDLPPDACWYTFQCNGISYTCPIENGQVLDIFEVPRGSDIASEPTLLNNDRARLEY